jgi:hypothetical protein
MEERQFQNMKDIFECTEEGEYQNESWRNRMRR